MGPTPRPQHTVCQLQPEAQGNRSYSQSALTRGRPGRRPLGPMLPMAERETLMLRTWDGPRSVAEPKNDGPRTSPER